jgi:HEAT repeat protein
MGPEAVSATPDLLGALNDGDARIRARAARLLGYVSSGKQPNDPRAGDIKAALTAAIRDPDPSARHAAAVALAWLRPDPQAVIPVLIEAAEADDIEGRSAAIDALGECADDAPARAAILAAVGDRDYRIRWHAINALGWRPTPARLPTIRAAVSPALKDEKGIVRAAAVEILCRHRLTSSVDAPELVAALSDPDSEVRVRAAVFLPCRPGSRAIIPALARATTDPEFRVRLGAVQHLGWIGLDAEDALPALRRATEDREEPVRREAAEAIRTIEAKAEALRDGVLPHAIADLASPDPDTRRSAAESLRDFGPRSAPAIPALIRGLDDREATVRLASARTLGSIGPAAREALPRLAALANDPDEGVRRAAKAAASAIGGEAPAR